MTLPLGDPTVWSGSITTLIDADPILTHTPRVINGGQIIMAQCADAYARSWTIVGNLTMSRNGWLGGANPWPGPAVSPREGAEGATPISVWLEVTQGVGRVALTQLILVNDAGVGGGAGLAYDQFVSQGGPYGESYTAFDPLGFPVSICRSFACVGAWVGGMISVRAVYARGMDATVAIADAQMSLLLTPYAPGAGV